MILKASNSVVMNNSNNPARKTRSAVRSYKLLLFELALIARKDNIQLTIKNIIATNVISSIIVVPDMFNSFSEVSTMKQIPNKLEEAFNMWGDLVF